MSKLRSILFLFFCFSFLHSQAQMIKRSTLCSTGKLSLYESSNKDSIFIESTFGQCPGCTVLNGGSFFLRQGFQQPLVDRKVVVDTTKTGGGGGGTGLPPCTATDPASNFNIDFTITEKTDLCGTYYDFEYTGDDKPNMKFGWDFSTTGVPQFSNSKNPSKIGFTSQGIKFVRLEAGTTCSKSITKTFNVTQSSFVAQAKSDGDIKCKGLKTSGVTLTVFGGTAPFTYNWSSGLPANTVHKNLGVGKYEYTVTDGKSCSFNSFIEINEPKDSLKVTTKVKDETCKDTKDGEILLVTKGGTPPYEFLWSDNVASSQRTNLSVGVYSVVITDDNGCTAKTTGDVKLYCTKTGKDFPNTFTPNDDGINDGWIFPGIDDFPNNKVEIFNRWGQLIYDKNGYKNGEWKGTNSKGEPLPAGPYYYVINLNDRDKTVFSGAVTIIR